MAKKKAAKPSSDWKVLRLRGQTVCVAGKGKKYEASADDVQGWCKDDGATVVSDLTDKTDLLVLMDIGTAAAKKKAAKLNQQGANIVTIDVSALRKMFAPSVIEIEQAADAGRPGRQRISELIRRCRAFRSPVDVSGINLKGKDLSDLELHGLVLRGADLREATLDSTHLDQLHDVRMDRAKGDYFHAEEFVHCQCKNAELKHFFLGARSHGKDIKDSDFSGTNFEHSYFSYAEIANSQFRRCNFASAKLAQSKVNACDFGAADFSAADLSEVTIRGKSTFARAKFHGTDLSGVDFGDSDLSRADFSGARMTGTRMDKAKLADTNFKDAILLNASFGKADTSKAKNLTIPPMTPAKPGPACKLIGDAAKKATDLQVTAEIISPDGPVTITARAHNEYGARCYAEYEIQNKIVEPERKVKTTSLTLRFDRRNFKDRIPVPSFAAALVKLAELWGHGELKFDTIACTASKSPLKGKPLKTAAIEALAEVFGRTAPSESELEASVTSERAAGKALKQQMLAELRGGRQGIQRFNDRNADQLRRRRQFRFRNEDFRAARMNGLKAKQIDFQNCQFVDANLTEAELPSANLSGSNFSGANLRQADLESADLRSCSLVGANLANACLDYARLEEADLSKADLSSADLWGAHLRGTVLTGAKLKGARLEGCVFDGKTVFPKGFTIPEDFQFAGPGHDPRLVMEPAPELHSVESFEQFMQQVAAKVDASRLQKALKMLKADRFQLYSDVDDDACVGIVRSQSDAQLVYSCRLTSSGDFSCCTQNLNPCGGLRGALCKHLLVLLIGLAKAEQIDSQKAAAWIHLSQVRKPALDKDLMAEVLLKFKGVEAGEIDWRPTETVPEDYFAI